MLLLLISIISAYAHYFSKFKSSLGVIVPLLTSIAGVLIVYFISEIMMMINSILNIAPLGMIVNFILNYLIVIFRLLKNEYIQSILIDFP